MSLKLLGQNSSIYALGNLILRAGAFVLIPIHTHYLTIEDYGIWASLFVTIEVLTILMNSGMKNSFVRFFNEAEQNETVDELIGTSMIINIAGGIIITLVCSFFLNQFFHHIFHRQNLNYIIEFSCVAALAEALYFQIVSYYQAKNEAKTFLYYGILTFSLVLLLNFVFLVILHQGIKGVLYARILSYGIMVILISGRFIYTIGMRVSFFLGRRLIKFGFPLIFAVSGEKVMHLGMIYILSFYAGLRDVAVFSLALKFASILGMILILPVQLALQPYIYANLNKKNIKDNISEFFTYFLFSISLGSLGVIIFSKLMIPIISPPEYSIAVHLVILLVPAFVFKTFKIYGEALLNIVHKSYVTGLVGIIIGLLSLYINYLCIVHWGLYGLVACYNILTVILAGILFAYGRSAYSIHIDWRRIRIVFLWLLIFINISYFTLEISNLYFYISIISAGILCISSMFIFKILNEKERNLISNLGSTINLRLFH